MWVVMWFFVSMSLRLCGLVSKLPTIKPTATEQNHRDTRRAQRPHRDGSIDYKIEPLLLLAKM